MLEVFKSNHLKAYGKEYWRLGGYKRIIREDHKYCPFDKEKYLMTEQALARRDGKIFSKKRVMVNTGILPSISEDTVGQVLQKNDLKWAHFQKKGILTKK